MVFTDGRARSSQYGRHGIYITSRTPPYWTLLLMTVTAAFIDASLNISSQLVPFLSSLSSWFSFLPTLLLLSPYFFLHISLSIFIHLFSD